MGSLLNGAVEWFYSSVLSLLNAISLAVLGALGCSLDTFNAYFPFASGVFHYVQAFAVAIVFLVFMFQNFKNNLGPLSDGENPLSLLAKSFISIFIIIFSMQIYTILLGIVGTPYQWMMQASVTGDSGTYDPSTGSWDAIGSALQNTSGSSNLLACILLIFLGWNYFKLVLEVVERYMIVGILAYTAPLPMATGAAKATSNIFKSWCRMVASQLVLLVINVWSVKMAMSGFAVFSATQGALNEEGSNGGVVIWSLCMFAFMKLAQKMDTYMGTIGMNTAQTGGSLLEEMAATGAAMSKVSKAAGGLLAKGATLAAGGAAVSGALGSVVSNAKQSGISGITGALGKSISSLGNKYVQGGSGSGSSGSSGKGAVSNIQNAAKRGFGAAVGATVAGGFGTAVKSVANHNFAKAVNSNLTSGVRAQSAINTIGNVAHGNAKRDGYISDNPAGGGISSHMGASSAQYYLGNQITDGANTTISAATIGDGKINGSFTQGGSPDNMHFTAYDAKSFERPSGDFSTVNAKDGSQWYVQTELQRNTAYQKSQHV